MASRKASVNGVTGGRTRREFLSSSLLGAGGILGAAVLGPFSLGHGQEPRSGGPAVPRRRLGRTGLMVSALSMGGGGINDGNKWLVQYAFDHGINYIDSAPSYGGRRGDSASERAIGEAGKGFRDRMYIATKFGGHVQADLVRSSVEGSLRRLQTEHIDVLLYHGLSSPDVARNEELLTSFDRLKREGKIRYCGASCHLNQVQTLNAALDTGKYDMFMMAYSLWQGASRSLLGDTESVSADLLRDTGLNELLARCEREDVGVIAMKVQFGGQSQQLDRYLAPGSTAGQAKIRWALENPAVASVISDMLTRQTIDENLAAVMAPLSIAERGGLAELVRGNWRGVCRMCGRCQRACPRGIAVADIQRLRQYALQYSAESAEAARRAYAALGDGRTVSGCNGCGACEASCAWGLSVRSMIAEAHALLA